MIAETLRKLLDLAEEGDPDPALADKLIAQGRAELASYDSDLAQSIESAAY